MAEEELYKQAAPGVLSWRLALYKCEIEPADYEF